MFNVILGWFLALLDHISRAHEIKIRPSVIRPSSVASLKLLYGFLSNFSYCFPWAICPDNERNKILNVLWILFVLVNMGPNRSENFKRYCSYKLQPKILKLVLNFPPNGRSSQILVWDFWNFEFPIFNIFFRKFQIHHCSLWRNQKTSIIRKTSDRRAKRSEIWDSWVVL